MDANKVNALAESVYGYAVETRRRFHEHPELSNQEHETTHYIISQLEEMGIPYLTPAPTGVIAVIQGAKPGKVLGIRADIDALPIQELNETPYRSQIDGVMHACGHDAHTASLLATAKALNECRDQLAGTVKLIFQPAEEYFPSGALAMMAKGDLDDCDAIIGVHVLSHIPVGKICVEAGGKMAASASLNIKVKGHGGHGGMPHQAVDAIVAASAIVMNLQTMASRELDANNPAVITIGTMQAGTAKNIIAEEAYMTGTMRYYDNDLLDTLGTAALRIIPPRLSGRRQRWRSFPACLPLSTILSYPSCPQRWLSTCLARMPFSLRSAQLAVTISLTMRKRPPVCTHGSARRTRKRFPIIRITIHALT